MEKKRVLFIQQEVTPFVEETPMSTIGRYLPQGIQELGREIRIFMPRYGKVNERRNQLHEVIRLSGMNLIINDKDHPLIIKVASIQKARMQIYFIDNDDFFSSRKSTFFDKNGNFFNDNDDRIVFFSRGVIETVKKLNWSPDIIHCHGWFTSLVPLYIKCAFIDNPLFSESKVIYSLYDDDFKGTFRSGMDRKAKLPEINPKDLKPLKKATHTGIVKTAIDYADGLIVASEHVNPEILEYAKASGKPMLDYQPAETYIEAYNDFYNSFLPKE